MIFGWGTLLCVVLIINRGAGRVYCTSSSIIRRDVAAAACSSPSRSPRSRARLAATRAPSLAGDENTGAAAGCYGQRERHIARSDAARSSGRGREAAQQARHRARVPRGAAPDGNGGGGGDMELRDAAAAAAVGHAALQHGGTAWRTYGTSYAQGAKLGGLLAAAVAARVGSGLSTALPSGHAADREGAHAGRERDAGPGCANCWSGSDARRKNVRARTRARVGESRVCILLYHVSAEVSGRVGHAYLAGCRGVDPKGYRYAGASWELLGRGDALCQLCVRGGEG